MFKGIILSDTTVITNTNIPFSVVRNSNGCTRYDSTNNAVQITSSGYYDILANIVATSTPGGTITAQLFADGVAIPGALSTITVGATGTATFTIIDNEYVAQAMNNNYVEISVRVNSGVTVNDAMLLIERRK